MPKSADTLEAEIQGLRERSDERMESINARIRSVHDGVGVLRGRAEENAKGINTLNVELTGVREDVQDLKKDLYQIERKFQKGLEDMKEEWSDWIESLGTKLKWTAAFLAPLVLGILALVLK